MSTGSRPTLLIYIHALAGGGAERVCSILASGFSHQGWRVVLAVDSESDANAGFVEPDVEVRVIGQGHVLGVARLARLLIRERPDVSLSALGASNLKHAAAAVLAGRRSRAVLSYHAFAASEPQTLSRMAYWSAAVLSRVTARTVAVSNGLRHDLVSRWHASATRTTTIYNPVLIGPQRNRSAREPKAPPFILAAGRLVPDKNMRGLVRAFHRIAPSCDARLLIIGEGPDRAAIEDEIAARGLHARVQLCGYVAEPWSLYREAACFVTASRLESFSMVIAEALSYGLPVVAYDSPGPREVLADGRYGTLVPADDEAALAKGMLDALTCPGHDVSRRARGRVFSVQAGLEAYRRLFHEVMAESEGFVPEMTPRATPPRSRLEPQ